MLDMKILRQQPDQVVTGLAKRGMQIDLEHFRQLDQVRRQAETRSQELLAERKRASRQVGELIKSGLSVEEAKAQVNESLERIEQSLEQLRGQAREAQQALDAWLLTVPNVPDEGVPAGETDADNIELSRWGEPRQFDFPIRDHVDLGSSLGGLDLDTAATIAGSRFAVLRGSVARLQRALTQFMLDVHTGEHGYQEVYVPYLVNADSLQGTGQLPKFEADLFKLAGEPGYYLIPTAEVPVTNLVRGRIVEVEELGPDGLRFVSHTPCFRSEAGSYGRDVRGLIRQHQFEKVELVQLVRPEQSDAALEQLTGHAETILQRLGLPYRKMLLCGGDLGFSARRTYDLEVWLPAQEAYREISSCSNFGDFQTRRMQARWRNPASGRPELLHSLNGSGLAVGRTLVALLENYQTADGKIDIPEVLVPYLGGMTQLGG